MKEISPLGRQGNSIISIIFLIRSKEFPMLKFGQLF